MQSRNGLLRMNLTYQGLNSSVDEQRASLVSSQCTKLCIGGVIQETPAVTSRCLSYFLSSSEGVVAFHIMLCRKHRQKWSFITNTLFWYRNSHSSPSTIFPRLGRDMQEWQGPAGLGAQRCCHPSSCPRCVLGVASRGCGKERSSWEELGRVHRVALQTEAQDVLLEFGTGCSGTHPSGGVAIISWPHLTFATQVTASKQQTSSSKHKSSFKHKSNPRIFPKLLL